MKKANKKPVSSVSILACSVSKDGIAPVLIHVEKQKKVIAPTNNKPLEMFFGSSNLYGRIVPDFATKKLSSIDKKIALSHRTIFNRRFFDYIKMKYVLIHLYS